MNKKYPCKDCGSLTQHPRKIKGKFYCYKCSRKHQKIIGSRKPHYNIESALERVYEVKGYKKKLYYDKKVNGKLKQNGENTIIAELILPSILVGHKVKLVLVK